MNRFSKYLLFLSVLFTSTCDFFSNTERGVRINTDKQTYTSEEQIIITIRNETGTPVYLSNCRPETPYFGLDRKSGNQFITAYEPLCQGLNSPTRIGVDQNLKIEVNLGNLPASSRILGEYRIRIVLSTDLQGLNVLGEKNLNSNTFAIISS